MKYHYFCSGIDTALVQSIAKILEEKNDHVIFFSSTGGSNRETEILRSMFENYNNQSDQSVLVVFCGQTYSNAFLLLFTMDKKIVRYLPREIVALAHLSTVDVNINTTGKGSSDVEESWRTFMVRKHQKDLDLLESIGLTKKQLALIEEGRDVCFYPDDLAKLCKRNKIQPYK